MMAKRYVLILLSFLCASLIEAAPPTGHCPQLNEILLESFNELTEQLVEKRQSLEVLGSLGGVDLQRKNLIGAVIAKFEEVENVVRQAKINLSRGLPVAIVKGRRVDPVFGRHLPEYYQWYAWQKFEQAFHDLLIYEYEQARARILEIETLIPQFREEYDIFDEAGYRSNAYLNLLIQGIYNMNRGLIIAVLGARVQMNLDLLRQCIPQINRLLETMRAIAPHYVESMPAMRMLERFVQEWTAQQIHDQLNAQRDVQGHADSFGAPAVNASGAARCTMVSRRYFREASS